MENNWSRHSRTSQTSVKPRRSGYEPSDNETDFLETPWHGHNRKNSGGLESDMTKAAGLELARNISHLKHSRRHSSRFEPDATSKRNDAVVSPVRRRTSSKSPYKQSRNDIKVRSPIAGSEARRNISPLSKAERRRHVSPFKPDTDDVNDADEIARSRRTHQRRPSRDQHSRRSATSPRTRATSEVDQQCNYDVTPTKSERTPSPLTKDLTRTTQAVRERTPSPISKALVPVFGEINEMIANTKLDRTPPKTPLTFGSSDSIAPGDIFFSRDCKILALPKTVVDPKPKPKNGVLVNQSDNPNIKMVSQRGHCFDHNARGTPSSYGLSHTTTTTSSSAVSRQSSKMSDTSVRTTESAKKFTANRQKKSESHSLFACMRKASSCRKTKSPERPLVFNEAAFIQKAIVIESLREFWADKHRPASLDGFTCHKPEAQLLKDLILDNNFPHVLFTGPTGSGKRALTMAFLREKYGDASWEITHDLRHFQIQEQMSMQVMVPLASSAHHTELNVRVEANARYALMGLVKEINSENEIAPEVSNINFKGNHKVLVLYDVDQAAEHIQHLIKWIMDCYSACKLILCCENDKDVIESVKNRCKTIKLDAPATHEITEVLAQIARKEGFDLPMNFANKIAHKSKQNLRKAIMGLEATKAHNYPFIDDQPIPLRWEEVLVEVAAEILADPSPKRLFFIRGKFQKLLVGFVHPKLILQMLVQQFLKAMDGGSKRDLYYWHAYYDKRLPAGASALLKLEEFVVKFMSIYRKSANSRQYV